MALDVLRVLDMVSRHIQRIEPLMKPTVYLLSLQYFTFGFGHLSRHLLDPGFHFFSHLGQLILQCATHHASSWDRLRSEVVDLLFLHLFLLILILDFAHRSDC